MSSVQIKLAAVMLFAIGLLAGCGGGGGGDDEAPVVVPPVVTLTANPTTIGRNGTVTLSWTATGTDAVNATPCTASGGLTGDTWSGTKLAATGSFSTAKLTTSGDATYTLTCVDSASNPGVGTAVVTVLATAVPTVTLKASPTTVTPLSSTTLTWTSTDTIGDNCTASANVAQSDWTGPRPANGNATVVPNSTPVTYTLTCTNAGGSGKDSATVTIATTSAPSVSITVSPTSINPGDSAILRWDTTNASACVATGGDGTNDWVGAKDVTGTAPVTPIASGAFNYTLQCTGPRGGTGSSTAVLIVGTPPVPTVSISLDRTTITAGESATLNWNSTSATSCEASGSWSGSKPTFSGSTGFNTDIVSTVGTQSYSLTCTGPSGSAVDTAVLTVVAAGGPPTVTISVSPATIKTGESALLKWNTTNVNSCVASGSWSGTEPTFSGSTGVSTGVINAVGTYSYNLTCDGPQGSAVGTAVLNVTQGATVLSCGIGVAPTTALVASNGVSVTSSNGGIGGLGCIGCSVQNPENVINKMATGGLTASNATIVTPLNLLGAAQFVRVSGTAGTTYPAGGPAGFLISPAPPSLLTVDLLQGLVVQTLLGDVVQETVRNDNTMIPPGFLPAGTITDRPLFVDLLATQGSNAVTYFGFADTTKPFDSVRLVTSNLVGLFADVKVYAACTAAAP